MAVLLHKTLGIQVPMYLFQKIIFQQIDAAFDELSKVHKKWDYLQKSAAGHLQLANGLDFTAFTWPYRPFIIDP